jgi:hypothetical protein
VPAQASLTGGTGSVQATFHSAGSRQIQAEGGPLGTWTAFSPSIAVAPSATLATLELTGGGDVSAGDALPISVVARDPYGNQLAGAGPALTVSADDPSATVPASLTLAGGAASGTVTLRRAGEAQVSVRGPDGVQSAPAVFRVAPGATAQLALTTVPDTSVAARAPVPVTVRPTDAHGNRTTGWAGAVDVEVQGGPVDDAPAQVEVAGGEATFTVTPSAAGSYRVVGRAAADASITGAVDLPTVTAADVRQLDVELPPGATAGVPVTARIVPRDAAGEVTTAPTTARLSATDPAAVLGGDVAVAGPTEIAVELRTAGSRTVTVAHPASPAIGSGSDTVAVTAAAPSRLRVDAPGTAVAGEPLALAVRALDAFGNDAAAAGPLLLTTSDPDATVPAAALADGAATAAGVVLRRAGDTTVTATAGALAGTADVDVAPAAASALEVAAPAGAVAGATLPVVVTARDPFGNRATGHAGPVALTSSDDAAVLPVAGPLAQGRAELDVQLRTAGSSTVSAAGGGVAGTSAPVAVRAAPASTLKIEGLAAWAWPVAPQPFTVTAVDAFGNRDLDYAGAVAFAATDAAAVLPAPAPLADGRGAFSLSWRTLGAQRLTVSGAPGLAGARDVTVVALPAPAPSRTIDAGGAGSGAAAGGPPAAAEPTASMGGGSQGSSGAAGSARSACRLPDLRGMAPAAARELLRARCAGVLVAVDRPRELRGRVAVRRQSPRPGADIAVGGRVTLAVRARLST